MSSTRKNNKWLFLPAIIALCLIVGVGTVIVANRASQNHVHLPPCEAMRPYIKYQGIMYFETSDNSIAPSDVGNLVTTIGDKANQAQSCFSFGTAVFRVKGYPITARLAVGFMLFEPNTITPTTLPAIP
jgi:hypothetical protein